MLFTTSAALLPTFFASCSCSYTFALKASRISSALRSLKTSNSVSDSMVLRCRMLFPVGLLPMPSSTHTLGRTAGASALAGGASKRVTFSSLGSLGGRCRMRITFTGLAMGP